MHPPQVNDALQTEAAGAGDTGADVTTAGTSAASQALTASFTAAAPSPNVQPAAPDTANTNAMRVEPAISSADYAEEVQSLVSVLQPAPTAAASKMETEVGIDPSCHRA